MLRPDYIFDEKPILVEILRFGVIGQRPGAASVQAFYNDEKTGFIGMITKPGVGKDRVEFLFKRLSTVLSVEINPFTKQIDSVSIAENFTAEVLYFSTIR